jgi:hypothetical protein
MVVFSWLLLSTTGFLSISANMMMVIACPRPNFPAVFRRPTPAERGDVQEHSGISGGMVRLVFLTKWDLMAYTTITRHFLQKMNNRVLRTISWPSAGISVQEIGHVRKDVDMIDDWMGG